jgi:hypothetical protein
VTSRGSIAVILAGLALGVVAVPACGREDVELVPLVTSDGATGGDDGEALGEGGRGEAGACPDASARACRGLGDGCAAAQDCCSSRCEGSVCLPTSCGAPGAACTMRGQCCSGLCEPIAGTPNRGCAGYCKRAGQVCARAQDCCSLACVAGACAVGVCGKTGDDCLQTSDCCSGKCVTGRCELDTALSCRPSGEDCSSGGGAGCCGACNVDGRCDVGVGPCRPGGSPCLSTADCCTGACVRSGAGGKDPFVCSSACIAADAPCTTSADCCAGSCNGVPSTCRAEVAACKLLGVDCASDQECCSAQCLGGRCGDNCGGPR